MKKNQPTTVEITKSDVTTGVELDGAKLTVLDRDVYKRQILITMVDNRTNYARDISDLIFDTYVNQIKIFPATTI